MAFTVKYAAPETIQGFRSGEESCTADPAVDVWAFGMICFELLTYQKFYGVGTTADEVMRWLTSGELLPSEKELDPHISGAYIQTLQSTASRHQTYPYRTEVVQHVGRSLCKILARTCCVCVPY